MQTIEDFHEEAIRALALVEKIKPLLEGEPRGVQGAALADLLAIYLAGHVFIGDAEKTAAMRAEMLRAHVASVRQLTLVNHKILFGED